MGFDLNAHARQPMKFPYGQTITVVPAREIDQWGDFDGDPPYTIDGCQIHYSPGGDALGNRETAPLAASVMVPAHTARVPRSQDRVILPGSTEELDIDGEPERTTHGQTGWQPHIRVNLLRTRIGGDGNSGV